ncbi:MAG: hypothetical protein H6713_43095 [Myxococcales bacterium]|nr:hypothetical protein [Myxococcales bacterium]MCB9756753.1 hypothetical protein [Myxococcales bacterium]
MTSPKPTSSFYPMARGDRVYILVVLGAAVIAFLPTWHGVQLRGMALRGWLLAALMLLAPIVALARLLARRRGARARHGASPAGGSR